MNLTGQQLLNEHNQWIELIFLDIDRLDCGNNLMTSLVIEDIRSIGMAPIISFLIKSLVTTKIAT